jgi:hypothetical protein
MAARLVEVNDRMQRGYRYELIARPGPFVAGAVRTYIGLLALAREEC